MSTAAGCGWPNPMLVCCCCCICMAAPAPSCISPPAMKPSTVSPIMASGCAASAIAGTPSTGSNSTGKRVTLGLSARMLRDSLQQKRTHLHTRQQATFPALLQPTPLLLGHAVKQVRTALLSAVKCASMHKERSGGGFLGNHAQIGLGRAGRGPGQS